MRNDIASQVNRFKFELLTMSVQDVREWNAFGDIDLDGFCENLWGHSERSPGLQTSNGYRAEDDPTSPIKKAFGRTVSLRLQNLSPRRRECVLNVFILEAMR